MTYYKSGNEVAEFDFEPSGDWVKITIKEGKRLQQEEAAKKLRAMLKPGSTVWTVLKHVGRTGMSRRIAVVIKTASGPRNISWLVARAAGFRMSQGEDALNVGGCGMDMGFHVTYALSRSLYPNGFKCAGKGCPSNDHANGDRVYTPHHHNDGGYALRHTWL